MNNWERIVPGKFLHIISLVLVVLQSCQTVFDPKVDTVGSKLVVDGSFSTVPGVQKVILSSSNPYNGNSRYSGINGANIYISDDQGKIIPFGEIGSGGLYETDTNELINAEIGRTYILHITTQEGQVFESLPQTVVKCAPVDSLFCEYEEQKIVEQNDNGNTNEVVYEGIRVEVNTRGLYSNHNFYLYSWEAYEEYNIGLNYYAMFYPVYTYLNLPSKYNKAVCTGNADDFSNQVLLHNRLLFITSKDLQTFSGTIPEAYTTGHNFVQFETFQGLIFKLKQKSISDNAFLFWNSVQQQLDASGKLFDPVASQIAGNINCTSNPSLKPLGVFYAYDVSEKFAYLYISKLGKIDSRPINDFPEIITDSLFWNVPPEGWISPSF
jgi:hypothetical protein